MDKRFINIAGEVVETPDFKDVTWRPSAYALVKNDQDEFLVMRLGITGEYCFPGGGTEIQENIQESAVREVWEETGYKVEVDGEPLHVLESWFYNERFETHHHTLGFFFKGCVIDDSMGGVITDKEDSIGVEWVKLEDTKEDDWNRWYWPVVKKIIDGEIEV